MKIMTNKQYAAAIDQARDQESGRIYRIIRIMRDELSETATAKRNVLRDILMMINPLLSVQIPEVRPKGSKKREAAGGIEIDADSKASLGMEA